MSMDLAWTAMQWPGLEHAIVSSEAAGFRADSQVILASAAGPVRLSYLLECDAGWQVRELTVTVTGGLRGPSLVLSADGAGHWLDASRRPRPDLDTCVDVDISCTPLTNTLPIRRLTQAPGTVHDITVPTSAFLSSTSIPPGSVTRSWSAGRAAARRCTGTSRTRSAPTCASTARASSSTTRACGPE